MTFRQTVQHIMHGDFVVTMAEDPHIIQNGAVALDSGRIVGVGPASEIKRHFKSDSILGGRDQVVMPGFVNGHTHAAMTLLRGYADDVPLMEWLEDYINPIEEHAVDEEFVRIGTELACWEMLTGGTTTFVDMYFFHEVAAQAVHEIGMRALISATVVDQPRNDALDIDDSFDQAIEFVRNWSQKQSTVEPVLGGHAIYTLKNEHLLRLRDLALELAVPVHIHVAESQFELDFSRQHYGTTPISHFQDIGLLDVPIIAAHVVWPSPEEISMLRQKRVGVIHNPTCNAKLASGTAPVASLLEHNVKVGLGTDGTASSNDFDMFEEMRIASLMQRARTMDSIVLPAREILKMATTGGAEAIGLGNKIGRLEEGMLADVIQVSIDNAHQLPMYDVETHLAYSTRGSDVTSVFVNGNQLIQDRQPTTIDTKALRSSIGKIANRIKSFKQNQELS